MCRKRVTMSPLGLELPDRGNAALIRVRSALPSEAVVQRQLVER